MAFWITVEDREPALEQQNAGVISLGDGGREANNRLNRGDFVIVYSPLEGDPDDNEPVEDFVSIGRVADDASHPLPGVGDDRFCRKLAYLACVETSAEPLIEELTFIRDAADWREAFSNRLRRIDNADFLVIAEAMLPPPIFQKVQSVAGGGF